MTKEVFDESNLFDTDLNENQNFCFDSEEQTGAKFLSGSNSAIETLFKSHQRAVEKCENDDTLKELDKNGITLAKKVCNVLTSLMAMYTILRITKNEHEA